MGEPNAIEHLAELLANEPEAGRDHKQDMDWCVDCAEWIAEHGAAVLARLLIDMADAIAGPIPDSEVDALLARFAELEQKAGQ